MNTRSLVEWMIVAICLVTPAMAAPPIRMADQNVPTQYRIPRVVEAPIGSHVSADFSFDPKYEVMLIQSRAKHRAEAHNGRVSYQVNIVRATDPDSLTAEARTFEAPANAKSVYHITVVKGLWSHPQGALFELGNLTHEGRVERLVNMVYVRGIIRAHEVQIGNVENEGAIESIFSSVNLAPHILP